MLFLRAHTQLRPCLRYLTSSAVSLSGHNKWSKIKEGKGANDKAKSKIYGKASRDILNAAKKGDSADPDLNSALAAAVAKAKEAGVPKANIQAALEQASKGERNIGTYALKYEVMLAGKVGLIIECASDNGTRTIRELKTILKHHGAQLSTVSYMFEKRASIEVLLSSDESYEELLIKSLDCGALDLVDTDDVDGRRIVEIETPFDNREKVTEALQHLGYTVNCFRTAYSPVDTGDTLDNETRNAAFAFIKEINDHPDVHWVHVSPQL